MTLKQTIDKLQELLDSGVDPYTEVVINERSEGDFFDLTSLVDISQVEAEGFDDPLVMLSTYDLDNPDEQDDIHLSLN